MSMNELMHDDANAETKDLLTGEALDDQVAVHDDAQAQAATEKFLRAMMKQIDVTDLSDDVKQKFCDAIALLDALNKEVLEKKQITLDTDQSIREKVQRLQDMKIIKIDPRAEEVAVKRLSGFITLLDEMVDEISRSAAYYRSLIAEEKPAQISVIKNTSDSFEDYIIQRIKNIKMYAKKAKKDLAVSFSRYCIGFDYQMKQIENIEQLVKNAAQKHK